MELLLPPRPSIFSPPDRGRRFPGGARRRSAALRRPGAASGESPPAEEAGGAAEEKAAPPQIRYRNISKKQARKRKEDGGAAAAPPRPAPAKSWEEMTLGEKAVELYVGEKGALYWLNKFAYASIFILIGGWIVFRFVGPSLGLYQLDGAPLSPTSMF
ncbi:uncharacterized protein LOC144715199 [Wolffia australiana]